MISLTGKELFFEENEIIVSKTDTKGIITYANDTFARLAEMPKSNVVGKPHNFIRHPFMPKCIFKLLWDTIRDKNEVFAYVLNRSRLGNEYWVLAHVTPSFDKDLQVVGFHSNRRCPNRDSLTKHVIPLYQELRDIENSALSSKAGEQQSHAKLHHVIQQSGMEYNQFIMNLAGHA